MKARKKLSIVLVGALAALALGSLAGAAIVDGNGVIHGCYDKNSGQLRVTDTTTNLPKGCSSKEAELTWNQQGPQGSPGMTGLHQVMGPTSTPKTSSGLLFASAACPAGERAIDVGYDIWTVFLPANGGHLGSAAASVQHLRLGEQGYANTGSVYVWIDATKLAPSEGVTVTATVMCAKVA